MKWLEIIELRSSNHKHTTFEKDLVDMMNNINCEGELLKISMFKHGTLETDYGIHLHHDTEPSDIRASKLGLCLVSALKEFGLVNHSIWLEGSI